MQGEFSFSADKESSTKFSIECSVLSTYLSSMQEERHDREDNEERQEETGHREHHGVHAHGADVIAGDGHWNHAFEYEYQGIQMMVLPDE